MVTENASILFAFSPPPQIPIRIAAIQMHDGAGIVAIFISTDCWFLEVYLSQGYQLYSHPTTDPENPTRTLLLFAAQ